jgi:hypothetical protein
MSMIKKGAWPAQLQWVSPRDFKATCGCRVEECIDVLVWGSVSRASVAEGRNAFAGRRALAVISSARSVWDRVVHGASGVHGTHGQQGLGFGSAALNYYS